MKYYDAKGMKPPYPIKEGYQKKFFKANIVIAFSGCQDIVITFMLIFVTTDSGFNP